MKNIISTNSKINKSDLKKLSKPELIKMLLKLEAKQKKPEIIIADDYKQSQYLHQGPTNQFQHRGHTNQGSLSQHFEKVLRKWFKIMR